MRVVSVRGNDLRNDTGGILSESNAFKGWWKEPFIIGARLAWYATCSLFGIKYEAKKGGSPD